MILVADSGSTKTQWALADDPGHIEYLSTAGYNPYFDREVSWRDELFTWSRRLVSGGRRVENIWYYGAGCDRREGVEQIAHVLKELFPGARVHVEDDLTGAAKALYAQEQGIALILGTGANAGYWDGKVILRKIVPVGYLLGDHGSGASLGLRLVRAWLDGDLPEPLASSLQASYGLSRQKIKEKVYLADRPNYYLASLVPFFLDHLKEPSVREIVVDDFRKLFRVDLSPLAGEEGSREVRATGSVAWFLREILEEVAGEYGFVTGKIIRYPIEELVRLHFRYPGSEK